MLKRKRGQGREDVRRDVALRQYRQYVAAGRSNYPANLCEHLVAMPARDVGTPDACEDHTEADGPIVYLRACLECGHVGCCDSSAARHATAHARETGHPVIQSAEVGETWRWCYPDEILG
jgi:hypothetical protein